MVVGVLKATEKLFLAEFLLTLEVQSFTVKTLSGLTEEVTRGAWLGFYPRSRGGVTPPGDLSSEPAPPR